MAECAIRYEQLRKLTISLWFGHGSTYEFSSELHIDIQKGGSH